MSLFGRLVGHVFYELWQHGREIEPHLARKDSSVLTRSTPGLERYFDKPPAALPRQNGFPVAIAMLMLLVAFAFNLLTLLRLFSALTPPLHALLFFAPAFLFLLSLLSASYLLARGYYAGIALFLSFWVALAIATVTQLLHALTTGKAGLFLLLVLVALWVCRSIFNGRGFALFTLYCRTQRMAKIAREVRLSGQA